MQDHRQLTEPTKKAGGTTCHVSDNQWRWRKERGVAVRIAQATECAASRRKYAAKHRRDRRARPPATNRAHKERGNDMSRVSYWWRWRKERGVAVRIAQVTECAAPRHQYAARYRRDRRARLPRTNNPQISAGNDILVSYMGSGLTPAWTMRVPTPSSPSTQVPEPPLFLPSIVMVGGGSKKVLCWAFGGERWSVVVVCSSAGAVYALSVCVCFFLRLQSSRLTP